MLTCDPNSDSFHVGERFAPEGTVAARRAVQARLAGNHESARRYAAQALAADRYAIAERDAGRIARRANVVGNAWSYWYEQITGRSSGW
jgi:hypothetical protein